MRRVGWVALIATIAIVSSAHIGSPDAFYEGTAGPYRVHVRVSPPTVVPGIAWVYVRTPETDIDSISVRPVFWRAGVRGAPPGEALAAVAGEKGLYSGKVWLMSRGAYSIYVDVNGKRGPSTATVPVMSVATSRLGLSTPLTAILSVLLVVLVAGLVSIVRAAASDSLVEPGNEVDPRTKRRGRIIAAVAIPVLSALLFGGASWWQAEDTDYQLTMFRPLTAVAEVVPGGSSNSLRISLRDTSSGLRVLNAPVMPDHGKMMHLFLVKSSSMSAFAHLHPVRDTAGNFTSILPPLPTGSYLVFADIVLETGAQYTAATTIDIASTKGDSTADADDAWVVNSFAVPAAAGARSPLANSLELQWETAVDSIRAGQDVQLAFSVRDRKKGTVVAVEPYLGMAAHAIVLRDDASVFIHLHPMGTAAQAAQTAFEQRDRGDTTVNGRLKAADPAMMHPMTMDGTFSFPYAFPKSGRYRIWVQVKQAGRIVTGAFEVNVP